MRVGVSVYGVMWVGVSMYGVMCVGSKYMARSVWVVDVQV